MCTALVHKARMSKNLKSKKINKFTSLEWKGTYNVQCCHHDNIRVTGAWRACCGRPHEKQAGLLEPTMVLMVSKQEQERMA
jgi:hypothetical protein